MVIVLAQLGRFTLAFIQGAVENKGVALIIQHQNSIMAGRIIFIGNKNVIGARFI